VSEWRETTLGDVLTLQRGFDLPARDRVDGPYPIVSSSGVTGHHAVAKVEPPGVVIGRYGSLGSVHWLTEPYWPHNTALWVKDFKGNDPRYAGYLLRTISHDGSAAAAVPGVNRNHLHALSVRVPDAATQRRISAVLAAFDKFIAINERRIELLGNLAKWLYREWFLFFRFPGHGEPMANGALPEGWSMARLGDIAKLNYGKALPAKRRRPGPFAVVSSAGVIDEHDEALVETPGIVLGRKGNVGSVWWVDRAFFPIDTTYYVETDSPLGLLYWQLRDMTFIDSHAAVPGLSRDNAYAQPVVVPPAALARQFAEIHDACFESITALHARNDAIATTRELLLPRLVTGRLDISDVDLGDLRPTEGA
jgi:type I restriction enzyme, S subunit